MSFIENRRRLTSLQRGIVLDQSQLERKIERRTTPFSWTSVLRGSFAPVMLVIIGCVAYANSFQGQFVFDDRIWLEQLDAMPSVWSEAFWLNGKEGPQHGRPIVAASFALNYWIGQRDPLGYHILNLAIHLLASLALFGLLRRTFALESFPPKIRDVAVPLSFASTAIWMTHPLQTECVNYLSQRTECGVGLAVFASLYFAVRSRERSTASLGWMVLSVAAAWFGAGCKEIAALIPLLVVLYEFAFRTDSLSQVFKRRWPFFLALCSCWIPVATLMALAPRVNTVGAGAKASTLTYLLNQCRIIPDYLRLAIWPDQLSLDYGEPVQVSLAQAAPGGLLILAILFGSTLCWRNRPAIGFAGWWIFLLLAPTSSIIPIQTEVGAERRMYLPLAALTALAVVVVFLTLQKLGTQLARSTSVARKHLITASLSLAAFAIVLTPLLAATRHRNAEYRDVNQLWISSSLARPNNPRSIYNLGVRYAKLGMKEEAVAAFHETLRIEPTYAVAHNNLGIMLRDAGDYAAAEWRFKTAATVHKNWALPLNNLARLYAACPVAKFRNGPEAVRIAEAVYRSKPDQVEYAETLAAAYAEVREFDRAVETLISVRPFIARQHPQLLAGLDLQCELYRWEMSMRMKRPSGQP